MNHKQKYVIRNEIGQFWTGSRWSDEYPDAELYEKTRTANENAIKALFKAVRVSVEPDPGYEKE